MIMMVVFFKGAEELGFVACREDCTHSSPKEENGLVDLSTHGASNSFRSLGWNRCKTQTTTDER